MGVSCSSNKGRRHCFVRPKKIVTPSGHSPLTLWHRVKLGDHLPTDQCKHCGRSYAELILK